jgi:hypothetical protein
MCWPPKHQTAGFTEEIENEWKIIKCRVSNGAAFFTYFFLLVLFDEF